MNTLQTNCVLPCHMCVRSSRPIGPKESRYDDGCTHSLLCLGRGALVDFALATVRAAFRAATAAFALSAASTFMAASESPRCDLSPLPLSSSQCFLSRRVCAFSSSVCNRIRCAGSHPEIVPWQSRMYLAPVAIPYEEVWASGERMGIEESADGAHGHITKSRASSAALTGGLWASASLVKASPSRGDHIAEASLRARL